MPINTFCALAIACAACVTDIQSRRIPNWLTFGAAAAALVFHTVSRGGGGFVFATTGWFVGALIMFLPFALRGLGGGDVKLVAALGAWLGPGNALWVGLYAGVAGFRYVAGGGGVFRLPADGIAQHLVFAPALDGQRHPPAGGRFTGRQQRTAARVRAADFRGIGAGDMVALTRLLRRFARAESGAEGDRIRPDAPLMLLVVLGIIEYGFVFQQYEVVTNAAREGARIAVPAELCEDDGGRPDQCHGARRRVPDRARSLDRRGRQKGVRRQHHGGQAVHRRLDIREGHALAWCVCQ
jgi:prepilin peptidase CpaA